jgi:EAL domain-containing protein (putative c-di-GMP-specific phosphodiesterase class I)
MGDARGVRGVRALAIPQGGQRSGVENQRVARSAGRRRLRRDGRGIIAEFGIDGGSVCLEITENVVVQDIETTRITLAGLKGVGVRVAIDDFGTGYSVLSHLKSLPVDTLKIDRGFVPELGSNPGDLAIVRAIIALADAFGLELVAEGVETEAAALTLLRHGCYRAQGFLLSRPIASDAMESLLAKGRVPVAFSATPRV